MNVNRLVVNPETTARIAPRPAWDDYFLSITKTVATRADCRRAQHGAVLVRDNRIISTGYNGSPAGDELSCLAGDCPRGVVNL